MSVVMLPFGEVIIFEIKLNIYIQFFYNCKISAKCFEYFSIVTLKYKTKS
jgi:hypothetical protein